MPLPIDVKPYALNGVIGGDNYLTHYKASGADGEDYLISEFYPAYMVTREDDGTLQISERFSKEFVSDREEFIRRAEAFQDIRDASLHPVVEVFERNNTAYIVRRACGMTTVDQYMGGQQMDFEEAYYFIRPLLVSMAQAASKRMIFNISPGDFRVNAYKQLVLSSPPSWEANFHQPLIQVVKLFYKLVMGFEASEHGVTAFSAYGIDVPPRIEAMIMEILSDDILYGSLDDFYKKFKSLIDGVADAEQDDNKKSLSAMRTVAAVLAVVFVLSLTLLVYGGVSAYRASTFWANPDIFVSDEPLPQPELDLSAVTLTHPRNTADALSGSFAVHDNFMFLRGSEGLMRRLIGEVAFVPGAQGILALEQDLLTIPNVVPSFIVGYGRYIFFVDTASGGYIYRASTGGNDLVRITDHAALHLAVVDGQLFFADAEYGNRLSRIVLETNQREAFPENNIFATLGHNSHLFYMAGTPGESNSALYVWNLAAETRLRIATGVKGQMSVFNDVLFYLGADSRVHSITFDGRRIATLAPENVRSFDIFFNWMAFVEDGRHVPRAYNMNTGNFATLSGEAWVSYVWTHDGGVYAIDHRNPSYVHRFTLPLR